MCTMQVNQQPLWRRFSSPACSLGCCACVLSWVIAVLLPFQLAYLSDGLWTISSWHWEQPEVDLLEEMVVFVDGDRLMSDGSSKPLRLSWASRREASNVLPGEFRSVIVRARSEDDFGDGRADRLFVRLSMPLNWDETAKSVTLMSRVRGRFHNRARLEVEGVTILTATNGMPGRGATVTGTLRLNQRQPIPVAEGYWVPYQDDPIWTMGPDMRAEEVDVASVAKRSAHRNVSLSLHEASTIWHTETDYVPSASSLTESVAAKNRKFELEFVAHIPTQAIWIQPALVTVFKDAWIQYLALFIPVFLVLWWILSVLLDSGAVHANQDADRVIRTKIE